MAASLVELQGAGRRFGQRHALAGVDLAVREGEIVGLAGPNGSGKTTLLRLLAGSLRPSAGSVRVFGLDPFRERARVMERARFAFAPPPLYDSLSAREHLELLSAMRPRGTPRVTHAQVAEALAAVGLAERADDRVRAFSFGMRQRLALAQAMLPVPSLLVLDEPTDGLDPLAVLELREILRRLRSRYGVAILLSSHLLIEVDQLVDRLLVLEEGRELFQGRPDELRSGGRRLVLEAEPLDVALRLFAERGLDPRPTEDGGLALQAGALGLGEAARLLQAAGASLVRFHEERPSLERVLIERLRAARAAHSGAAPESGEAR